MAITDFYKDTVQFYQKTYTQDDMGGRVEARTSRGDSVSCRVEDMSGEEAADLGVNRDTRAFRIFCSPTYNVYELDQADFTYNNQDFVADVIFVDRLHQTSDFHHYEITVTEQVNQIGHNS